MNGESLATAHTVRDLRRTQIMTQARAIVAKEGLEALTFGALEKRLHFTRGVITYHFSNKDEIIEAVLCSAVNEINERTREAAMAGGTLAEKIHAVISTTTIGFLENIEATRIIVSFWGRIQSDPSARRRNAELYDGFREKTRSILAQGIVSGELDPDIDTDAVAAAIVGIVIGIVTQTHFQPEAIDPQKLIKVSVRGVLASLSSPSPGPFSPAFASRAR